MRLSLAATLGLAVLGSVALAQDRQVVSGPRTVYWMDMSTHSGLSGSGGNPLQAIMGGGGGGTTLHLEIASQDPSGRRTEATHTVPAAARIGPDLRLEGEDRPSPAPGEGAVSGFERPEGRLFLFFGCGETAPRDQPVVIDFARVAQGQMPQGLQSRVRGAQTENPPSSRNWPSYAWGPQARGAFGRGASALIPAGGSLVGDHRVQTNFGADIRFSLASAQDLLAPVRFTTNALMESGAASLAWTEVPRATGYAVAAMGPGEREGDFVYWSASAAQTWDAGFYGFLPPEEAARLVRERVLLSPQTTRCAAPREAVQMMGAGREDRGAMVMLTAFGPEANFADPPRPSDPRTPWAINWTVKVRTASHTMDMLGQPMSAMMEPGDAGAARDPLAETAPPPGTSQRDWCRERADARAAQARQSAGSSVGGAIGDALGVPGAGAAGRALGGLLGRGRSQEPADPYCPS